MVHFRFKPTHGDSAEGKFVRSHHLTTQHSHLLTVDERRVLMRPEIFDEVKLYLTAGLTLPMIVNCVNSKFNLEVSISGYSAVIRNTRKEIHSYVDFS